MSRPMHKILSSKQNFTSVFNVKTKPVKLSGSYLIRLLLLLFLLNRERVDLFRRNLLKNLRYVVIFVEILVGGGQRH